MKTPRFLDAGAIGRWLAALFLLLAVPFAAIGQLAQPAITSIRNEGTNVVVTAQVPPGLRRVTLECRERVGPGAWEPRVVTRVDGSGGNVEFRLARSRQLELIRVRGDASEPLPAAFYSGTNAFANQPAAAGNLPTDVITMGPGTPAPTGTPVNGRDVVESDIWKIRGQTLYFFNQLRGLQVVDISSPDAAVVRGTFDLPAAGEQMYLLGAGHVVLLARKGCSYTDSEVIVVAETNGQVSVSARLPVAGSIQESRLVGTALYVASQSYRPVANTTNTMWEWGTLVSSFDLANPNSPVSRDPLWYSGYGNVVTATDRLLFVVTQDPANWWQSIVRCIDITSPDGSMNAYESIRTAGRVPDTFKLNWDGATLSSISEDWHWDSGQRLVTKLETFHLPDPRSLGPLGVIKLGELELGQGERLRATHFDGRLAYIVTFFQIDPLWVVDLEDPSAPRVAGSVDVPGWSTFIEPLGNRLVTLGIESNRVAVSLFDVANPAAPVLLSRVRLGERYSWSDANWDEKAFTVLPEDGLILVPYSGDTTNGYAARVQLIDLKDDTLTTRGVIERPFAPRRATLYTDRILSISGAELVSVDATDRDNPQVRGTTPLAWPVDRVFVEGNFVIELSAGGGWGAQTGPELRVASTDSPDQVIGHLALANLPVLGSTTREGRLYLVQGQQSWFSPYFGIPILVSESAAGATDPLNTKLLLTIIALNQLPDLPVVGQVETNAASFGYGGQLQAVWPRPDVLVWAGGGNNFWWGCLNCPIPLIGPTIAPAIAPAIIRPWPIYWGGNGGHLIAFDVGNPASPQFASEVSLGSNTWWSFSKAFTTEGLVYLSHQTSEFVTWPVQPSQPLIDASGVVDVVIDPPDTNTAPAGDWVSRSYLDVVDYTDPRQPVVRQPVNIPGTLAGLSHQGAVLYTTGTHWTTNWATAWIEYLDASAYDGVSAHLIDSVPLPNAWPRPLLVTGTNIFIGRSGYTNGFPVIPMIAVSADATLTGANNGASDGAPHALETWYLSNDGKLTQSGSTSLSTPASALASFGALLATQAADNDVILFDATNPAALREIGEGQPPGCLGFDVSKADGNLSLGLWIPLGAYGVTEIPLTPSK